MSNDAVTIGIRNNWGQDVPVLLSCDDRRKHLYVVGKSGTGKTTLLRQMILQDIEAGRGVGVIDPHGDLAVDILNHFPRKRIEELTYFDPSDEAFSVGFNPLANVPPNRRHLVASGIVAAFKNVFGEFFGPRMEYVFYAAVSALLECQDVSLLALPRMLTEERYRAWVVKQVKDPMVRRFWEREFEPLDKKTKMEMVSPILNKVGPLFMTPLVRNILGQVRNRVDARFMMDRRRVFIANLSKGKLGPETANLVGSFLVALFQVAAMSRADVHEASRRDFFLYVDEFQSFISDSFAVILSEARKYRLCLTVAHQYLSQLKPSIANAVIGNVGSLVAFRVGHEDAEALELAFGKTYTPSAFTSLNDGEVYAKYLTRGQETGPFLVGTIRPTLAENGRLGDILARCRMKYSTPRHIIEEKIAKWLH